MRALAPTLILILILFSISTASANTKIGTNITGVQWVNATNLTGEGGGITNILIGNIPGLQSLLDWINGTHNTHANATTGVHGVGSGEIVGTTLQQNLTNKTLTNPIVAGELTLPGNPTNALSAIPKQYADALIAGLTWKDPITLTDLISDSATSPPASSNISDAYLISSPAGGAWSGLENHLVEWNGSGWIDFGTLSTNTRLGISIGNNTLAGGSFAGKDNQIATISSVSPYTFSYTSPVKGDAFFVENSSSINSFYGYVYGSDGAWHKFSRVSTSESGLGLSYSGNTLNIGTDNSNHITISADGIDVGSDVLLATGSYSNPSWLTSLAWVKLTGVPSIVGSSTTDAMNNTITIANNSANTALANISDNFALWSTSGGGIGESTTAEMNRSRTENDTTHDQKFINQNATNDQQDKNNTFFNSTDVDLENRKLNISDLNATLGLSGNQSVLSQTNQSNVIYTNYLKGNDTNNGTLGYPKKTIQAALNSLGRVITQPTTIAADGISYETTPSTSGLIVPASLTFEARNSTTGEILYDNGTVSSADTDEVRDTSKTWTVDKFKDGKLWIRLGTGNATYINITGNNATSIYTNDTGKIPVLDTTSKYVIGSVARFEGNSSNAVGFSFNNIQNIYVIGFGILNSTAAYDIDVTFGSYAVVNHNFLTGLRGMRAYSSIILSTKNFFQTTTPSVGTLVSATKSYILSYQNVMSGLGSSKGIVATVGSTIEFSLGDNRNVIKNYSTGISYIGESGGTVNVESQIYSGNTVNIDYLNTTFGTPTFDDIKGASILGTSSTGLLINKTPSGVPDGTKYLRDDNTWQTPSSGAPATSHYIIDEADSSLVNATVIPYPHISVNEEWNRKTTNEYINYGTETIVLEHNLFGTHKFTSALGQSSTAGFSIADTANTTNMFYNVSLLRELQFGINPVNVSGIDFTLGMFNTSVNLSTNKTYSGVFFNYTNYSKNVTLNPYWNASTCSQGKCTTVNTTIAVQNNTYIRFRISSTGGNFYRFYINETQVANITTTLPINGNHTAIIGALVKNVNTTTTPKSMDIDWIYYKALRG